MAQYQDLLLMGPGRSRHEVGRETVDPGCQAPRTVIQHARLDLEPDGHGTVGSGRLALAAECASLLRMSRNRCPRLRHLVITTLLGIGLVATASAKVRTLDPADYRSHRVSCHFPVRLTEDCSIQQGAVRPIAFGDFRMNLASGNRGRTILLSRLRRGPDHNGTAFARRGDRRSPVTVPLRAISLIDAALQDRGIRLQRLRPVYHGRRVSAYFLDFSANAYDYLKQFTVLESEHWLPRRQR